MLFRGRIAPDQQIANAERLPTGSNHGPAQLTLNTTDAIFVRNNGWFWSTSTAWLRPS